MSDMAILVTAVTALVAVVVGPIVSVYIARRHIRTSVDIANTQIRASGDIAHKHIHASVVSANRQTWINTLRDSIAEYLAKQTMTRNFSALKHADESSLPRIEEIVRLNTRIELLINPRESDHAELASLICQMTNTLNQQNNANKDFDIDAARKRILVLSQSILKREWERVKRGD